MLREWMNISETAELLGVHPSTVRHWADKGRIPVHRTQGGHRRFRRSDVNLWFQARHASDPDETRMVFRNALKQIRMQVSEGRLLNETWYQKLDDEARMRYRLSGRVLIEGLIADIADGGDKASAEARALGYEYAARGRKYHLTNVEATKAFLFFSNSLLEAMFSAYEAAAVGSPLVWSDMLRKFNKFTDQILLTLLETYNAFQGRIKSK